MSLKLMYITNNIEVAKIAENYGVDRIFVDLEYMGKSERQKNLDTVKSSHSIDDVKKIKNILSKSELLVRINPINSDSANEIDNLKWAIDYFFYHFDKENFLPIIYFENNIVCKTLFEKSIYNSSSKIIRKLGSRDLVKNLIVDNQEDQIIYKCKSYVGNDIVLRIEDLSHNLFNAINKCPSIIAALYYNIVKENCKSEEINIIYNVPGYDRIKVDLGTEAFFSIYFPYFKQKFGISKVNIININWIDSEGSCIICDRYTSKNSYSIFLTN